MTRGTTCRGSRRRLDWPAPRPVAALATKAEADALARLEARLVAVLGALAAGRAVDRFCRAPPVARGRRSASEGLAVAGARSGAEGRFASLDVVLLEVLGWDILSSRTLLLWARWELASAALVGWGGRSAWAGASPLASGGRAVAGSGGAAQGPSGGPSWRSSSTAVAVPVSVSAAAVTLHVPNCFILL